MSTNPHQLLRIVNGHAKARTPLQRQFRNWVNSPEGRKAFYAFSAYAAKLSEKHDHFSADAIFHTIRTRRALRGLKPHPPMNNNFTAYASRLWEALYPQHSGFFRTRRTA